MADFVAAVALNSNVPEECPSLMDLCIQVWLYKDSCYSSHSAKSIVSLPNLIYLALSKVSFGRPNYFAPKDQLDQKITWRLVSANSSES